MGRLIANSIGSSVAAMKEHEAGLRAGQDPDHVRKTRVAVRRLRSNLRTFEDFLDPSRTGPVVAELAVLAATLGGVRDREVLAARIRTDAKVLPAADRKLVEELLRALEEEIRVARVDAIAYLDSERFTQLFTDLEIFATAPPLTAAAAAAAAGIAGPLVTGPWEKLRKAVRGLPRNPPDAQLHRVRILAKRARYAAMAVAPVIVPAQTFAAAAAEVQTILGDHQDAVTTEAWLAAAPTSGRLAFAAGQLAGLERAVAMDMRGRWREAWKALSAPELRAWMEPAQTEQLSRPGDTDTGPKSAPGDAGGTSRLTTPPVDASVESPSGSST